MDNPPAHSGLATRSQRAVHPYTADNPPAHSGQFTCSQPVTSTLTTYSQLLLCGLTLHIRVGCLLYTGGGTLALRGYLLASGTTTVQRIRTPHRRVYVLADSEFPTCVVQVMRRVRTVYPLRTGELPSVCGLSTRHIRARYSIYSG